MHELELRAQVVGVLGDEVACYVRGDARNSCGFCDREAPCAGAQDRLGLALVEADAGGSAQLVVRGVRVLAQAGAHAQVARVADAPQALGVVRHHATRRGVPDAV